MGEREFQTHDNQIQLMVHGIICAKIYPHSNTPNGNDNNNDKSFGSPVNGNDRISLSSPARFLSTSCYSIFANIACYCIVCQWQPYKQQSL